MLAPEHSASLDAPTRSCDRHGHDRVAVSLHHCRELLHPGTVRQASKEPHGPSSRVHDRGKQPAQPGLAQRRIHQAARRVGRHPIADERDQRQRAGLDDPHVHPAVDATRRRKTHLRRGIEQPVEREPPSEVLRAPGDMAHDAGLPSRRERRQPPVHDPVKIVVLLIRRLPHPVNLFIQPGRAVAGLRPPQSLQPGHQPRRHRASGASTSPCA